MPSEQIESIDVSQKAGGNHRLHLLSLEFMGSVQKNLGFIIYRLTIEKVQNDAMILPG